MNELKNDSAQSAHTSRDNRLFLITVSSIVFILGLSVGFLLGDNGQTASVSADGTVTTVDRTVDHTTSADVDFDQFWEVWDSIQDRHVDKPIDEGDLVYAATAGLVAGIGDPNSTYFQPDDAAEFLGEIDGNFEGIGAEITSRDDRIVVVSPLPNSPAEQAGLFPEDVILAIDGIDTAFMSLSHGVQLIRGEAGTQVTLTIQRGDGADAERLEVTVTRDTIQYDSVEWEVQDAGDQRIAVITISNFHTDTTALFQQAVSDVILQEVDSVILDLRNNPGGLFQSSIQVLSQMLPEDATVVLQEDSTGERTEYTAQVGQQLEGTPIVVLINGGSASASEIVAGALQDHAAAHLIGDTSFGKGTVQDVEQFQDGSALKLTIARWLTPNGSLIDGEGITPDTVVERTIEDVNNDQDPQMDAAILYLTDEDAFTEQFSVPVAEEAATE